MWPPFLRSSLWLRNHAEYAVTFFSLRGEEFFSKANFPPLDPRCSFRWAFRRPSQVFPSFPRRTVPSTRRFPPFFPRIFSFLLGPAGAASFFLKSRRLRRFSFSDVDRAAFSFPMITFVPPPTQTVTLRGFWPSPLVQFANRNRFSFESMSIFPPLAELFVYNSGNQTNQGSIPLHMKMLKPPFFSERWLGLPFSFPGQPSSPLVSSA